MELTESRYDIPKRDLARGRNLKIAAFSAPFVLGENGKSEEINSREEVLDKVLNSAKKDLTIQRYKGLGEMNPEQLRETVFSLNKAEGANPVLNEHMLQVVVEDAHQAGQLLTLLMSSDVGPRKQWLLNKWAGEEAEANGNGDEAGEKESENGE